MDLRITRLKQDLTTELVECDLALTLYKVAFY